MQSMPARNANTAANTAATLQRPNIRVIASDASLRASTWWDSLPNVVRASAIRLSQISSAALAITANTAAAKLPTRVPGKFRTDFLSAAIKSFNMVISSIPPILES